MGELEWEREDEKMKDLLAAWGGGDGKPDARCSGGGRDSS